MGSISLGAHLAIVAELGATFGRRVSSDPSDELAAALDPPPSVTLRAALGCQYSR
jgi:hypothetical protein